MKCRRCHHRFTTETGFAGIHLARGTGALEHLRNGQTIHLCGECAECLSTWLGIMPQPGEPERELAGVLPGRPFDKYFEE